MPCVFRRDNVNALQDLKSPQGDVAQITDRRRHHVKHRISSNQNCSSAITAHAKALVPTMAPGPGYVWTTGYWRWTGSDYVWVPGSWLTRPRPAAVWVTGHWVRRPGGWAWVAGHW